MGIRGLRKCIERRGILQPFNLKNTTVVVDGNNICYQLLYQGSCRHYGGDYAAFKTEALQFFQMLTQRNVQPYVVFDGAHDEDDKKLMAIQKKCEAQIKENEKAMPQNMECTPPLMYETFTAVLKQLHIPHLACEGEADNQIALLAKQWRCPIISGDTDMYIFDLPGGVIYFSDLWPNKNQYGDLNTRLYLANNFERKTGVSTSLLPLAATILGNAYVEIDYNVANCFFQRLGARSTFSNIVKNLEYAFELVKNVRERDDGLKLLNACLDEKLSGERALQIKRKITTSITFYTNINKFEGNYIANLFTGQGQIRNKWGIPIRVLQSILSCSLSGLPIDIVIGRVILKPTLEDYDFPPVQQISLPIRQVMYGIVLKSCSLDKPIEEIIRENRQMVKKRVSPKYEIAGLAIFPTIQYIDTLDKNGKLRVLASIFHLQPELLMDFPDDSKLFILALNYFIGQRFDQSDRLHYKSYIFCHVLLSNKENHPSIEAVYQRLCAPCSRTSQDIRIFHIYLQSFHECLNTAYGMNLLVGTPLRQPDPATVYDGQLMFHLFRKNLSRDLVDQMISQCFADLPRLQKLYGEMTLKFGNF